MEYIKVDKNFKLNPRIICLVYKLKLLANTHIQNFINKTERLEEIFW